MPIPNTIPRAMKFKYKDVEVIVPAEDIMKYILDYIHAKKSTISNLTKITRSSNTEDFPIERRQIPPKPEQWLIEAMSIEQKDTFFTKHVKFEDELNVLINELGVVNFRTFAISKFKGICRAARKEISALDSSKNNQKQKLNSKINKYSKLIDLIEENSKEKLSKILEKYQDEYKKIKKEYNSYLASILTKAKDLLRILPTPSHLIFYNLSGYVVSVVSPGKRYAGGGIFYSKLEERFNIEKIIARSKGIDVGVDSESLTSASDKCSDQDVENLRKWINRKLNESERRNNASRLYSEKIRLYFENDIEDRGGPSYPKLRRELASKFQPEDGAQFVEEMRCLLRGAGSEHICKEMALLTAAWFLSEVSRNPTTIISSLIIMDFIEAGTSVNTPYGKVHYTWQNALWDNNNFDEDNEEEKKDHWGGLHPMCHTGSFSQIRDDYHIRGTFNPLHYGWELRSLTPTRWKELEIIIHWFEIILGKDFELVAVYDSKKYELNFLQHQLWQEFRKNVIKQKLDERLKSFDNLLNNNLDDNNNNNITNVTPVVTTPRLQVQSSVQQKASPQNTYQAINRNLQNNSVPQPSRAYYPAPISQPSRIAQPQQSHSSNTAVKKPTNTYSTTNQQSNTTHSQSNNRNRMYAQHASQPQSKNNNNNQSRTNSDVLDKNDSQKEWRPKGK